MDNTELEAELDAMRALILDVGKALIATGTLITSTIALLPEGGALLNEFGAKWEFDAAVRDKDGNFVIRNPDGSILHRFHEIPA